MVPIVSIANLISSLTFLTVTLKVYFSYRESRTERLKDFFRAFICITVFLIILSLPGLVIHDLTAIGLIFAVFPFFMILALAYLGAVPLKIMNWKKIKEIFLWSMVVIAFFITILNLLNLQPATVLYRDSFVIFQDARGELMNNVLGVILAIGILSIIMFFIIQGFKTSERYLRLRAFLIATGLFSLFLSSLINFVFAYLDQSQNQLYIISQIITVVLINLAAVLIMFGVYYKPKDYGKSD